MISTSKISLLCVLCSFFLTTALFAQTTDRFSIGPRVGVNLAKVTELDDAEVNPGLVIGLTSMYSIQETFGLGVDLLYSQEGHRIDVGNTETSVGVDYIRLLPTFNIFFRDLGESFRPKIYIGPSLGFLVSAESKVEDSKTEVDVKDAYNGFDLGLLGGLGFNYRLANRTWLNVDGRFIQGLLDVRENKTGPFDGVKNQNIQFSVGIAFGL